MSFRLSCCICKSRIPVIIILGTTVPNFPFALIKATPKKHFVRWQKRTNNIYNIQQERTQLEKLVGGVTCASSQAWTNPPSSSTSSIISRDAATAASGSTVHFLTMRALLHSHNRGNGKNVAILASLVDS